LHQFPGLIVESDVLADGFAEVDDDIGALAGR
jgi:hypothetical protein